MRKLHRHTHGEKHILGGVFSGLGEWMEVSPGILRVGFAVFLFFGGIIPAVLLYFAAMFLIKKHPHGDSQPVDHLAH